MKRKVAIDSLIVAIRRHNQQQSALDAKRLALTLGERQAENYRSWIRQNSERTEFWRIQLRILLNEHALCRIGLQNYCPNSSALQPSVLIEVTLSANRDIANQRCGLVLQ